MPKIPRGSDSPSEAYYQQELGQKQCKLRLQIEDLELLKALAVKLGTNHSALVARLVREEWARQKKKR